MRLIKKIETLLAALLVIGATLAFPAGDKQLDTINKQIDDISDKLERLKKEESSVLNDIYKVELRYEKAVIENNKIKIQLRNTGAKVEKKNAEKRLLEKEIQDSKRNLKKIIRILYKIGGNTYLKLFVRIDNLDQLFQNYRLFIALINYKSEEIDKIKTNIQRLNAVKKELDEEYARISSLQEQKEQKVRAIGGLKHSKLQMMRKINSDRKNYLQMLDELEAEAARLNELIYGKKITRRFGVIDLDTVKGKLPWPIRGKVVSFFGKQRSTRFNTYILNNGIKIKPSGSDNIEAIYPGEVVFSDYYKGYGNLVILQHAKNLYSLYGHCDKILKNKGDNVKKGETISIAGDSGSTAGKALYFEIRTHSLPQDPLKWLVKKR
jgi:septal ring factor EnvC (AmiA/AmiB activator)